MPFWHSLCISCGCRAPLRTVCEHLLVLIEVFAVEEELLLVATDALLVVDRRFHVVDVVAGFDV